MTEEQIITYLNKNKHLINLSGFAKFGGINVSVLNNSIAGRVDGHGTLQKIPKKRIPKLIELIESLQLNKELQNTK